MDGKRGKGGFRINSKCEVRIYDKELNWQAVVPMAESVQIRRDLYGTGSFEIHVSPEKIGAYRLAVRDSIIIINGDGQKAGIVENIKLSGDRRKHEFVITGSSLDGLSKRRITVPPNQEQDPNALGWDKIIGPAETVMKHYAGMNLITPYDPKRKIPGLIMNEDLGRGIEIPWKSRYTELDLELENMGVYAEMGYRIYADLKERQYHFDIIEGTDRTKSQEDNSPVTFRTEYQNMSDYTYIEDYKNYSSTGYAGGEGEDEKRLVYIVGAEFEGFERVETFLDCASAANIDELIYYGEQKMIEHEPAKTVEAAALKKGFIFERDFFLGDKVTVYISKLGLEIDTRITSVLEVWEKNTGYRYEIRFGGEVPNIFTILNKREEVR